MDVGAFKAKRRSSQVQLASRSAIEALEQRTLFAAVSWIGAANADFNTAADWSTGVVPGASDDVTIDVPGVTVTISSAQAVNSLSLSSPLTITSPTGAASLNLTAGLQIQSTTLQLGSADAVSSGQLIFTGGDQFINGDGTATASILFAGTANNLNEIAVKDSQPQAPPELITGGVTIHGSVGQVIGLSPDATIINESNIEADGTGLLLIQAGATGEFQNNGQVGVSSGVLDLEGSWTNVDQLEVSGTGTLDLGGTFSSSDATRLANTGGTVNITGVMSLNSNFTLNSATGNYYLDGGTIDGGSSGGIINSTSSADVILTAAGGTLNNISLTNTVLDATTGTVNITNGLAMQQAELTLGATMDFVGTQTFSGMGTITFVNNGAIYAVGDGASNPATLSTAVDINISGTAGTFAGLNAGDSIISLGVIDATAPGTGINLHGGSFGTFTNAHSIQAEGGTINITGAWANNDQISATAGATLNLGDQISGSTNTWENSSGIYVVDSTLNLGGDVTENGLGFISRSGGAVNITGTLDLQGGTETLTSQTGNWNLEGGTIEAAGSTINSSGGSLILTPVGGIITGGVTLGPGSPVDASNGMVDIIGGLTLANSVLNVSHQVLFSGTQTLGGTGTITLEGELAAVGDVDTPATLTIGNGISVTVEAAGTIGGLATGDSVVNDGTINASMLGGTVTMSCFGGTITNAGTLNVAPGAAVAVNPNFTTTATSTINLGIDALGNGAVDVTGTVALAGTLNLATAATFTPPQGMVYNVLNFTASTGAFNNILGLAPTDGTFTPAINATSLTITATFGAVTGLRSTVTTAVSSSQNVNAGSPVTFTATVAAPSGDGIMPTGTVSFYSGGVAFGTATLDATQTAVFTTSSLPVGLLMVTAVYSGDTAYASSASAVLGETIGSPPEKIGGLSQTFGTQGLATHAVGFTATSGVAVAASGQSIVAGTIGTVPNESFGITRYNADGSLDTTFGTGGVFSYSFGATDDAVSAISVLPGGQLLVAGTATTYVGGVASGSEFALAEFNADGTLNTSFGSGTGEVLTSFSTTAGALTDDVVKTLVVSAAGNIYLGGHSNAGGHGEDFAIAAYSSIGAALTSFNSNGQALLDFNGGDDQINSLAIQKNGDVVAGGSATVNGVAQIALARYLPTGILDKHFGTLGDVTTNVRGVYDSASSVVIQAKGQIIIGGVSATGSGTSLSADFVLARFLANGRIDPTFGGGTVITSFGQPSAITQVVQQANGEIVASGKTTASLNSVDPSQLDVAVARYTVNGALDTTFNGTGKTILSFSTAVVSSEITVSPLSEMLIEPLDASTLGSAFDSFINSQQGVVATTVGGAILAAGNSGANTVEAQIIIAGVDLVAGVTGALPAAVPGGMKGTATVTVGENGSTLAKGTVTVQLEIATDAQGDGASPLKSVAEKINLRQGVSHAYKLAFVFPAGILANNYYLLVTILDGATLNDLDANNNTALSTHTIDISPPSISLSGSSLGSTTANVAGKSAGVEFDLTNSGNVLAHGRILIDLYFSTDDTTTGGMQVASVPLVVSLAAGKAHLYHLKFSLSKTAVAGSFNLLALIDPANALGATDHSDSLLIDPTLVTIS